jgi:hypothetical protein
MNQEELREFARRQLFEPFRVILTTGAAYDIRHPDLVMVGRRSAIIGISNEPNGIAYDRTIKVELLHVVGVEELPASPPSSNGPAS